MGMSKEERLEYQKEYRRNNGNNCTLKYEKTINGFLMRCYRNMTSRVKGIQSKKYHLYKDKYLLDKKEFYGWSNRSKKFKTLFKKWVDSGYSRKLTPSVDRIDSSLGYSVENMEWVTHSENSRRGGLWKKSVQRSVSIK